MKVVAVVQARMGSTRLPNKVMKDIMGEPMLAYLLNRLAQSEQIHELVVATSLDSKNDPLESWLEKSQIKCFRGSEDDVLLRYVEAARNVKADVVVRITGDCPLMDARLVDRCIQKFLDLGVDYLSNVEPATFPDGLDIEVFKASALELALKETDSTFDHEHVTPYIRRGKQFSKSAIEHDEDLSSLRWTVDEQDDFDVIEAVFKHFSPRIDFSWQEVLLLQKGKPEMFSKNSKIQRNEGLALGEGQKLWKRAKKIIPGGNMLLSKRSEMFLPEGWPSYFERSKGCRVWDLDGRELIDTSIMGIGTNILGYGHDEVDQAVSETVMKGNMSSLNCPEEVLLAEKLVELHPWADMVRFARSGGEANAMAVRIARAASGRDKVAICGYHGWHDWYLSANLSDDQGLDGHLLPGLEPKGVPRSLAGTVLPFQYNDFDGLQALVSEHEDIGVIKMEVSRNEGPEDDYLQKVRALATEKNIVLIFDECTSGFRETYGGLHLKYGVEPDMAMFGKAMGNGYAITATIGRREIMEAAQTTFISSTFWTERIGPTAALKTLEVMKRERSWEQITELGLSIRERWQTLAEQCHLNISHWGMPALTGFSFESANHLKYKTLLTQEMLKKGFLASNSIYVSIAHTPEVINAYFEELSKIFALISDCESGKSSIDECLEYPVCHSGFKRLN